MESEAALEYVDSDIVRELKSRVPGIFYCDERYAELELRKETIFSAIINTNHREMILQNLKQICYLIPFIRIFQENFKYLRPYTHVIRKLISGKNYTFIITV
jgi:hypothetical protein